MKEHNTVNLSSKNIKLAKDNDKKEKNERVASSKYCWSMIHSLSRSITFKAPSELKISCDGEKYEYLTPNPFFGTNVDCHDDDPHFDHGDCLISKISIPWRFEEKTGAKFLYGRHFQNTTFMNIPTGIINFKYSRDAAIFNYIPRINFSYTVDYLHPLTSMHLLEDKKLIVETYVDRQRFMELNDAASVRQFFIGNNLKLFKLDKKKQAEKTCPFRIGEKC